MTKAVDRGKSNRCWIDADSAIREAIGELTVRGGKVDQMDGRKVVESILSFEADKLPSFDEIIPTWLDKGES